MTPTPTQSTNYFQILTETIIDEDDDATVVMSNLSKEKHHCDNATLSTTSMMDDKMSDTDESSYWNVGRTPLPRIKIDEAKLSAIADAVFDSGATAHFIIDGAPVVNKKKALHPLKIKLPDDRSLNRHIRAIWIYRGYQIISRKHILF